MPLAQFRQIGIPTTQQIQRVVCDILRRFARRLDALISRPPPTSTLLRRLQTLGVSIQQAHGTMPMPRLAALCTQITSLHEALDTEQFFYPRPNAPVLQDLQAIRTQAVQLLRDLTAKPEPELPQTDQKIQTFLEVASKRGWRIAGHTPSVTSMCDDFEQSLRCMRRLALPKESLLPPDQDIGVVSAPILLMTSVPEKTLQRWVGKSDVFIVFRSYVMLSQCRFLGVTPRIARNGDRLDRQRFQTCASLLDCEEHANIGNRLVARPRRVADHYYCPIVDVGTAHREYFRTWDLLVKE